MEYIQIYLNLPCHQFTFLTAEDGVCGTLKQLTKAEGTALVCGGGTSKNILKLPSGEHLRIIPEDEASCALDEFSEVEGSALISGDRGSASQKVLKVPNND